MSIRPEEISAILKQQIERYQSEVRSNVGTVIFVVTVLRGLWSAECHGRRVAGIYRRYLWHGAQP